MASLTTCLVLFALFCTKGAWSIDLSHNSLKEDAVESRIRGGAETTIEEHPYQAFLQSQGSSGPLSTCSGAILSEKHIVTAAQCVSGAESIDVRVGSTDRTTGGTQYTTTTFMAHPMFMAGERDYDVAIVVIEEGITLDGQTVDTIDVVDLDDDPSPGDAMTISGWGKVGPRLFDPISITLKEAELNVISRGQCSAQASGITDRLFCIIDEDGSDAACQGDFGDPAVNDQGMLAGVVSRTVRCDPAQPQPVTRFGEATIRAFIMSMSAE